MNTVLDSEIIAVITAAIAAMEGDSGQKFRINKIQRVPLTAPVWNFAGRLERMAQKL